MKVFQTVHFQKGGGEMLSTSEKKRRADVLRRTEIFSHMSEQTEDALLSLADTEFSIGETIADGDDFSSFKGLGVLLSGKASIYGRDSGKRVLLNRIESGEIFGAATVFFSKKDAVSTVIAGTKCTVLFIERTVLESLIENDFAVASAYIAFLSERIYFLNRKIIGFTAKNADAAFAGYLLRNADENGALAVNMSRIASTLDIGRTTLYRAADALEAEGAIRRDGKQIAILDRELLEKKSRE